ncbi:MAG: hypothetical protein R3E96_04700 [Planctomycetota bacterium]
MDRQLVLLGQLNQILASVQDQASADAAREDYAEVMRQLEDQPDLSALSDAQSGIPTHPLRRTHGSPAVRNHEALPPDQHHHPRRHRVPFLSETEPELGVTCIPIRSSQDLFHPRSA